MAAFETKNLRMDLRPDGIAYLRIDVPDRPVNVLNQALLADLDLAFANLANESAARLLVIRGEKPSGFLAGSDLHEFAAIRDPAEAKAISAKGQTLFNRLASLKIPTIALIHGPCLGGGLELAMACDYRLVLDHAKTQLGLPEVELGLIPGWGGTQRLPRIVGLERALQVILGGRRLSARDAGRWGLADATGGTESEMAARLGILTIEALRDGKRFLGGLPLQTWRQKALESNPPGRFMIFRVAERMLKKRVPDDMPAPWEALRAIRTGLSQGMEAGLAAEREAAGGLATGLACRNLIRLFLQREAARKQFSGTGKRKDAPRRIAIVGAGTMGAGIAQLALLKGLDVTVKEVNDTALKAGLERLTSLTEKAVEKKILTKEAAQQKLSQLKMTTSWEGFRDADLVVEAVLEDLPLKQAVFRDLEEHTRPTTLLATNTSSLLVSQIQANCVHPERVAGLHFFNPVHKLPLVEVVRTPATSDETATALAEWAALLGKTPIPVKDSPGFVVNRILMPYLYEAVLLASQKIPAKVIDESMRRFGMPMGPLELLDQVGIDVACHIVMALKPIFSVRSDAFPAPESLANCFVEMRRNGWLGQKSGAGFYRYQGKQKKVHAAALDCLPKLADDSAPMILAGQPAAAQAIEARERMVLLMVNEAAACLGENLAADAGAIDLAMVLGTGWAPHRGGPLQYMLDRGKHEVIQALNALADRLGSRFRPCAALLNFKAKEDGP